MTEMSDSKRLVRIGVTTLALGLLVYATAATFVYRERQHVNRIVATFEAVQADWDTFAAGRPDLEAVYFNTTQDGVLALGSVPTGELAAEVAAFIKGTQSDIPLINKVHVSAETGEN